MTTDKPSYAVNAYYHSATGIDDALEAAVVAAAGRNSDASGYYFAGEERDHCWYCETRAEADKIKSAINKIGLRAEVEVLVNEPPKEKDVGLTISTLAQTGARMIEGLPARFNGEAYVRQSECGGYLISKDPPKDAAHGSVQRLTIQNGCILVPRVAEKFEDGMTINLDCLPPVLEGKVLYMEKFASPIMVFTSKQADADPENGHASEPIKNGHFEVSTNLCMAETDYEDGVGTVSVADDGEVRVVIDLTNKLMGNGVREDVTVSRELPVH